MKMRQLRKRKPVPELVVLSRAIRSRIFDLARKTPLRNDAASRERLGAAIDRVVERQLALNPRAFGWPKDWMPT